jgi:peroxiredoxin
MNLIKIKNNTAPLIAIILILIPLSSCINAFASEFAVGSANDDWWTTYPDQSKRAGEDVSHPSWIMNALQEKPVLIYVNESCSGCGLEANAVQNISDEFQDKIALFKLEADGTNATDDTDNADPRSDEVLQAYSLKEETSTQAPQAPLPLTVIITLATNYDGEVVPVWHSTDETTGDNWIRNYLEDAIMTHDENSDYWI